MTNKYTVCKARTTDDKVQIHRGSSQGESATPKSEDEKKSHTVMKSNTAIELLEFKTFYEPFRTFISISVYAQNAQKWFSTWDSPFLPRPCWEVYSTPRSPGCFWRSHFSVGDARVGLPPAQFYVPITTVIVPMGLNAMQKITSKWSSAHWHFNDWKSLWRSVAYVTPLKS